MYIMFRFVSAHLRRLKLAPRGEVIPKEYIKTICLPLRSFKEKRAFTPGGERRREHSP
jgi:hypothetical protein